MNVSSPQGARADIDSVLAQIRAMQAGSKQQLGRAAAIADVAADAGSTSIAKTDFSKMLGGALKQVNAIQQESAKAANAFATGESKDLVGTMLASQKASVAIQATIQVRNRVVSAYQDIMKMPI